MNIALVFSNPPLWWLGRCKQARVCTTRLRSGGSYAGVNPSDIVERKPRRGTTTTSVSRTRSIDGNNVQTAEDEEKRSSQIPVFTSRKQRAAVASGEGTLSRLRVRKRQDPVSKIHIRSKFCCPAYSLSWTTRNVFIYSVVIVGTRISQWPMWSIMFLLVKLSRSDNHQILAYAFDR